MCALVVWRTIDEVSVYLLDGNAAFKSKEWVFVISLDFGSLSPQCKHEELLSTKITDALPGVQQNNNYTPERDIEQLFQSWTTLGAWWYSTNKAHQLSELVTIYTF